MTLSPFASARAALSSGLLLFTSPSAHLRASLLNLLTVDPLLELGKGITVSYKALNWTTVIYSLESIPWVFNASSHLYRHNLWLYCH